MISHWAATQPERLAAIENDVAFSYAMMSSGAIYLRDRFRAAGVTAGAHAIVYIQSPIDSRLAIYALRMLGADVVPIPHLSGYASRLASLPDALLVMSEIELKLGAAARPDDLGIPLHLVPAALRDEMHRPRDPSSDPIVMSGRVHAHSSGTTGPAKRLVLVNAIENEINERRADHLGMTQGSLTYCGSMGAWGIGGFRPPVMMWHLGAVAVFEYGKDRERDICKHGVTHAYTVPTSLAQICRDWPAERGRIDGTMLLSGGGPMSAPLIRATVSRLTRRIVNVYGASELSFPPLEGRFEGDPAGINWLEVQSGVEVEIVRDDGSPAAVGETGRLRVRTGPDYPQRYEDAPEASARHFRDGAFYPGDLAVRRADGRIRIAGREDDVLNLKGSKRPSGPIEARLLEMLEVEAVCVFVGLDGEGVETLVVCIENDGRVSKDALRDAARALAREGRVAFSLHKRFPRGSNGMGKVLRRELRAASFAKIGMQEQGSVNA
ncbi:MAG: class I adenylate-forming enzyme family protein [Pseudomonadota bacterium]